MNMMPGAAAFAPPMVELTGNIEAERALVGLCLIKPEMVGEILAKLQPTDLTHPVHGAVLAVIDEMVREGRTPSLHTVLGIMGDTEVGDGRSFHEYLRGLARAAVVGQFMPWKDALEVVRDIAHRRALHAIASDLVLTLSNASISVAEIAAEAVAGLDEVTSAAREGKRRSYGAIGAADDAFEHFHSEAPLYPTTGIDDLDNVVGGWPKGQLTIIAGRPGMAKSGVAVSSMLAAAKQGVASAFFSLEMTGVQIGARMLTDLAYTTSGPVIEYESILRRENLDERMRQRLRAARDSLASLPIKIEEQRGLTLAEIATRSRKIAQEFDRAGKKLDTIWVDHMGLIRPSSRYAGNKVNETGEISDGLATLAKELDTALIALCQLNRGVEGRDDKRPNISDLRNSGDIEQDASLIVFPYRPAYYLEKRLDDKEADSYRQQELERVRHVLELGVGKNRNGRTGTAEAFIDIGANAIRRSKFRG